MGLRFHPSFQSKLAFQDAHSPAQPLASFQPLEAISTAPLSRPPPPRLKVLRIYCQCLLQLQAYQPTHEIQNSTFPMQDSEHKPCRFG